MKVKAIQMGYYAHRRMKPGDLFELSQESDFSDIWMAKVDENGKAIKVAKSELKAEAKAEKKSKKVEVSSDDGLI